MKGAGMCFHTNKKGFTLIEIMLVVTIIGVLAMVVIPRLAGRSEEARVAAAKIQIENIGVALDAYELDNGRYPSTDQGLSALYSNPGGLASWKGPYLKKKLNTDPWGVQYVYSQPGTHGSDYDLQSCGPDRTDGGEDDITSWSE